MSSNSDSQNPSYSIGVIDDSSFRKLVCFCILWFSKEQTLKCHQPHSFCSRESYFHSCPVLTDLAEDQLLLNHFNHPNELRVLITSEWFSITKYPFDIVTNTIGPKLRKNINFISFFFCDLFCFNIFMCFLSVLHVHDLRMNETTFCPNLLNEVSYNICLLFKSQLISCISQFLHLYILPHWGRIT